MKIKYEFANETIEIEVEEEWADIVIDLDRQEYNINHKETRRHCSLEAYNLDDALLPSDEDVERDVIADEDKKRLYKAIAALTPDQQELVHRVYFNNERLADIAREQGVSRAALTNRMNRIIASLKKFFLFGG